MKVAISLLLVFCFFTAVAQQRNTANPVSNYDSDSIHWRADYKLKPEDFKGKPETTSRFAAVSNISIIYNFSFRKNSFSFNTFCVFNKKESWLNLSYLNANLLEHEQGHFDIGEIYKKKLTLEFERYSPRKGFVAEDLNQIYKMILQEMDLFNKAYDKECAFPPNQTNQKIWTKKIQNLLIDSCTINQDNRRQ